MFEMIKQNDKLFKAIKIIRVKILFMKTYIHSVKKNELHKEVWEILATIWCKLYFPVCKWKIWECQMYWTVVCQLSWSWCFKWILSKTIIWFTTIFSVLGWYILYFWNKKNVFKMPETIFASIAIRRKWNPFIDYEKRAIELKN